MEQIKRSDFMEYKFLSQLKLSPNGSKTAVIAKKASDSNGYYSVIYIDKGDGFYPLTREKGSVGFFQWLDDENIIFSEQRCPKVKELKEKGYEISTLYKININGGEASEELRLDLTVKAVDMIAPGKYLVLADYNNARPDLTGKTEQEKEELLKEYKKEADYQVVDELPYWYNGKGFTNKMRSRLYIYSEEGLKPVTGELTYLSSYVLSKCKKYIAYETQCFETGVLDIKSSLYLYDIEKGESKKVLGDTYFIKSYDFYNGKLVVALSEGDKYNFHQHPEIYFLSLEDGSLEKIIDTDLSVPSGVGSDCKLGGGCDYKVFGDDLYCIILSGYRSDVYKLNLTGSPEIKCVTSNAGSTDMFDISEKGIVAVAMYDDRLQEVYTYEDGKHVLKSAFNTHIYDNKIYSKPQHFTFNDADGFEIDGWVIAPVGYQKGKKYPAILNIHGGPKAAFGDVFFHEMQYWASEGYFVLFSNPRGSDGKGNEFAEIRGKYGTVDYDNIMQFTDEALKRYPDIDSGKIGVTGGSYGGFMTNWIVGHTNRFKAAASQRSIANWVSFSNICDIGYYFGPDQQQADTWSDVEKLWWHSPLKYANNVKTPILFLHSDEDHRCWIPEAYQMFTAVKLHGADTRLCIFHGENHELSRSGKPEHRERRLKEITEWMDKYLK